jgi:hypothetical protein
MLEVSNVFESANKKDRFGFMVKYESAVDHQDGLSRAGLGMGLDATGTEHGTILGDHAEGELGATEIES